MFDFLINLFLMLLCFIAAGFILFYLLYAYVIVRVLKVFKGVRNDDV